MMYFPAMSGLFAVSVLGLPNVLAKKGLFTIEDLLYFLPRRYEDRRIICRISELVPGIRQTILGKITHSDIRFYGKRRIFEVSVDDGHGVLKAKWFKGRESFLQRHIYPGKTGNSDR